MNDIINILNQDGVLTVSSREVAANFNKQHKHVLEKVLDLSTQINSAEKSAQYFTLSSYTDSTGKDNKEYLLTRDGFSLLVMGFTGQRALEWKLKYIDAFNIMELKLREAARTIECYEAKSTSVGEVANLLKVLKSTMKEQGSAPSEVTEMANMICEQFNIKLPKNFVKKMKTREETYLEDPFVRDRQERKEREFMIWGFSCRDY